MTSKQNGESTSVRASPLKWHGGKSYLAKRIIELMPPRCRYPNAPVPEDPGWLHYVEPYFGGGAVLLANDPNGISEVVNDIHFGLTNFWRVLQDQEQFAEFQRIVQAIPFSQAEYRASFPVSVVESNPVHCAVNFFIHCRQSMSGRMNSFAPVTRNRTRRGMNEQVSAWLNGIDGLPAVHSRMKRVLVLNDDAVKVIKQQDGPRTLYYCDPTYIPETRTSPDVYAYEMTVEQHVELLETLAKIKGRFILSGYDSDLYHEFAQDHNWSCDGIEIDNKSSKAKTKEKKRECLWRNYC